MEGKMSNTLRKHFGDRKLPDISRKITVVSFVGNGRSSATGAFWLGDMSWNLVEAGEYGSGCRH
jgi:hypothetical protein